MNLSLRYLEKIVRISCGQFLGAAFITLITEGIAAPSVDQHGSRPQYYLW